MIIKTKEPIEDIYDVVREIGNYCIENKWYRTDNHFGGWHYFTADELKEINAPLGTKFTSGHCFLDNDDIEEEFEFTIPYPDDEVHINHLDDPQTGLVRLYMGECNPKFCFWRKDEQAITKVDLA